MKRYSLMTLLLATLILGILIAPKPAASQSPQEKPASDASGFRVVGYFIQWGMYSRNYRVKDIVKNGAADKLTDINYAFANVSTGLTCYEETRLGWGDSYADYEVGYTPAQSVDGKGDSLTQPLKGHFNQLKKLKAMYPNIKVLMSIGGYSWSGRFSDAALPQNREKFVKSCIDLFVKGNLPFGAYAAGSTPGAGSENTIGAGVFDGIDIDWEYPAMPGFPGDPARNLPPNVYRPEDTQNFTALLAEFRRQLDELGNQNGKHYLLTIAAPAGEHNYSKIELDKIHPYLDWINVMTYDIHGTWDAKGPTNFNAPLYSSPNDPAKAPNNISVDSVITAYLNIGIPPEKLVMGVPFYGRGWTNVPNVNNGLYQSADTMQPAPARFEAGIEDYHILTKLDYPKFRDPITKAMWIYDGKTWWNYDDPEVIAAKTAYIKDKKLGGVMFWSLDGDNGDLVKAISDGLK